MSSLYIPARDDWYNDELIGTAPAYMPGFDFIEWKKFNPKRSPYDPFIPQFSQVQKLVTASKMPPRYAQRNSASQMAVNSYAAGAPARRAAALARAAELRSARALVASNMQYTLGPSTRVYNKQTQLVKQVKALIQGKKRDAADVSRATNPQTSTTISCLTSSTDFAVAASGTGLLDMDGDKCLINTLTIRQAFTNTMLAAATFGTANAMMVRTIIVWFYKPLQVPSAAGTLPPITEVLVTDSVGSLYVPDTANAGRFTVLYDKTDNLGRNLAVTGAATYTNTSGNNKIDREIKLKIDKSCSFSANAQSGTPAGSYDSDVAPGRISKGLLCLYTVVSGAPASGTLAVANSTRLNYTG